MASDAPQPPGPLVLRIKLRYPDVETFVEKFAINVGRSGLFLTTRGLQPVATELRFELRLADDQVVLAGVGRVAAVYELDEDRPEAPYGMAIEFMRVTREGRDLVMRMLEHRRNHGLGEPTLPVPASQAAGQAAALEGDEARRSSGALRVPQRPAALEAERPRIPRTRAIELVAHLAAQPAAEAEREAARSEAAALDALLARTTTQERTAEALDLTRALERARAIAGASASAAEDDRFSAELAELSKPIPVPPLSRVPLAVDVAEGTLRGVSAAMREQSPRPTPAAAPPEAAAAPAPAPRARASSRQPLHTAPPPAPAAPPPAPAPPPPAPADIAPAAAGSAASARPRFSAFTRRPDDPLAEHTPPPGFAPQATPSGPPQHLPTPRPGAPSTLAGTAQMRAQPDPEPRDAEAGRPAEPPEVLASDADTTQPDAEPRRKRIGRPERLTRPPGVFARRAEATAPPPIDAVVVDTPLPAPEPELEFEASLESSPGLFLEPAGASPAAGASTALAESTESTESGGRAMSDATFARVLAELEDDTADPPARHVPLFAPRTPAVARAGAPSAPSAPYDPLDQLALDDLDDAEAASGPPGRRAAPPWYATVDETLPVQPVELAADLPGELSVDLPVELDDALDHRLDSALEDSGFEILAEAEVAHHDALEGTAASAPRYDDAPSRRLAPQPAGPGYPDEPAREPITARSALAAAVSRPTWTRSKALDQAEPPPPVNELAPPTIPGRVATRDIDLESALDALDIEADAPAVPLRPRQPEHDASKPDDDDFPIELEFDE